MYINARDLLALILYPVVLLNSLMSSSSFLVASLGYPMYSIRSYVNSDSFISSFPIWILLVSYSLIVMAKIPKLCWITVARVVILVLFLILEGIFCFSPLRMMYAMGLSHMTLNWCFWTVVLEKTLESLLDCKEIQPVHSRDQSWVFIGRTDAKAETPVLWPPHVKSWLIGKDSNAGRDWGQEEKGTTEDKMAGWHHWLDGCESQWTPGVGDGQGGLVCCDSWGCKE